MDRCQQTQTTVPQTLVELMLTDAIGTVRDADAESSEYHSEFEDDMARARMLSRHVEDGDGRGPVL